MALYESAFMAARRQAGVPMQHHFVLPHTWYAIGFSDDQPGAMRSASAYTKGVRWDLDTEPLKDGYAQLFRQTIGDVLYELAYPYGGTHWVYVSATDRATADSITRFTNTIDKIRVYWQVTAATGWDVLTVKRCFSSIKLSAKQADIPGAQDKEGRIALVIQAQSLIEAVQARSSSREREQLQHGVEVIIQATIDGKWENLRAMFPMFAVLDNATIRALAFVARAALKA